MTVRKMSVWPVVQPEQCKLGTFSTAAASALAGRSALIGTRDVRIRGPYFHLLSFHDLRSARVRIRRSFHSKTETVLLYEQFHYRFSSLQWQVPETSVLNQLLLFSLVDTKHTGQLSDAQ